MSASTVHLLILCLFVSGSVMANPCFVDNRQTDDTGDGLSWATAKKTIQAGIDVAASTATDVSPAEVWIRSGVYKPASNIESFLPKRNVHLYGGFAGTETNRDQRELANNQTILSGDINGDDQWRDQWGSGDLRGFVVNAAQIVLPEEGWIPDLNTRRQLRPCYPCAHRYGFWDNRQLQRPHRHRRLCQ